MNLAILYGLGAGVPQSDAKAVELYELAATQGDVHGQYYLGKYLGVIF